MSIEQRINSALNKVPVIKRIIKRLYQGVMYTVSIKIKSEGNIVRITPEDEYEYFFGYYDKSPWDASNRYMLCHRVKDTTKSVAPKESAEIILIDTQNNNSYEIIAKTKAWNVQQGCMLQWLGPDYSERIIFNDFRGGKYCSVILNIKSREERVIDMPVYSVSNDGKFALTLDFSRLHRLRKGYGYSNLSEKTANEKLPNGPCIWHINFETNETKPVLKYTDFTNFESRPEMSEAEHKVNHIMLNPSGDRFMVLHRWFNGTQKFTRLVTANIEGDELFNLSDDNMTSHCTWKSNDEILAYTRKKETGNGYYLMRDKTKEYTHMWPELISDGHPSYSPDGSKVVTDTYPNRSRVASVYAIKQDKIRTIAKVFAPFKYDNDTRCDLHPRWNHAGDKICFDSIFEGHRGLYMVDIQNAKRHTVLTGVTSENEVEGLVSCVIPTYRRCDTVTRAIDSVLMQTYPNVEVLVVDDNEPNDEYSIAVQEILKKYNDDGRVRYIQQKVHMNGAVARNEGIKAARGEYIAFLDDDDEWLNTKIEKQMSIFKRDSKIDAVTCLWAMYKKGKEFRKLPVYTADNIQFKILMREVAVYTSTVILKRSAVLAFGGFDETLLRHQDLQFLTDAADKSKFGVVPEHLVKLHTDSEINRPNVEKLINAKKAFFEAEKVIISNYSKKDRKRIKNAHYYEVVFSAIKSKKTGIAIKYILKAGINTTSIRDLYKRVKER